ncbi:MAG: transposase [Candidatus Omnitrophota bacterium]|nr:transposase [Candidatus Omnitrophota bacterium]
MATKKFPLVTGEIYHIFSKSIADFEIFKNISECERMKNLFKYYNLEAQLRFAMFKKLSNEKDSFQKHLAKKEKLIEIIAYCLMPTHLHLVLKQSKEKGISIFMSNILNSYTRYFNIKIKRKGPLWEGRFRRVLVRTDEQLLHLTRYVHLNPVTAYLVNKPQDWQFSSYKEYLGEVEDGERICNYSGILDVTPQGYKEFVNSHIDYQRELARIKDLLLE